MVDIDFVYLWVDGNDPKWIAKRNACIGEPSKDEKNCKGRYESNDELNGLALGGGGRYADMIKSMVGIDVSGMGYAIGVDRLIAVMENQGLFNDIFPRVDAVIMGLDKESKIEAMKLASVLRDNDLIL